MTPPPISLCERALANLRPSSKSGLTRDSILRWNIFCVRPLPVQHPRIGPIRPGTKICFRAFAMQRRRQKTERSYSVS